MRIPQPIGTKGSLRWIQILINRCPSMIDETIFPQLKVNSQNIIWLSPLESDNYAEYRDDDFLNKLGLEKYSEKLHGFWPKGGPQWDALGKGDRDDTIFLVEAKANIPEINSSIQAKFANSISKIHTSLHETQKFLNCKKALNWEEGFYQYANRIAHLYFFREICCIEAYLIFIYFTSFFHS